MNELLKITKFENAINMFLFFSFPLSFFFCDDCICTTCSFASSMILIFDLA